MNFFDFIKKFPTEEAIIDYFIKIKYGDEIVCPKCGTNHKIYQKTTRKKVFDCNSCHNSFSIFKGTIFEKSSTDLRKWFYAIHLMLNSKKGISGLQLQREIDVTYKTAWRMLKQIRIAMGNVDNNYFEAMVEIDETYVGGKPRKNNKHKNDDDDFDDHIPNKRGRGTNKTPVVGLKERNTNKVQMFVALPNQKQHKLSGNQLLGMIDKVCKKGSTIISDEFRGYNILDRKDSNYVHLRIDHTIMYADGNIHTNGIESVWSLIKRGIYGIYHHVSIKHLQNYLNEYQFRLNNRTESKMFDILLKQCVIG
ncbi:MAG: IS1595 family transposase [Alphaproteobacteria bacterium]